MTTTNFPSRADANKVYAVARSVPEDVDYLTAGKRYEVIDEGRDYFRIKADDVGDSIGSTWKGCSQIDTDWTRIEADEEGWAYYAPTKEKAYEPPVDWDGFELGLEWQFRRFGTSEWQAPRTEPLWSPQHIYRYRPAIGTLIPEDLAEDWACAVCYDRAYPFDTETSAAHRVRHIRDNEALHNMALHIQQNETRPVDPLVRLIESAVERPYHEAGQVWPGSVMIAKEVAAALRSSEFLADNRGLK